MMVVPLYYRGRLMGTMTALNRPDQPDFTEEDLAQFSAIAGQVSVALANAQLSDETAYLKRFNEGIVQGVAEAILVTDEDERITFANPAAEAMLGYSLDALVGRPCTMLFPPELNGGTRGAFVCRSGVAARFETLLQAGDGRRVSVLASVRPLYQDGEIVGSLAALTDITELKQAEDQLRQETSTCRSMFATSRVARSRWRTSSTSCFCWRACEPWTRSHLVPWIWGGL